MNSETPEMRTAESVRLSATWRRHTFDVFAAAGGLINFIIIMLLVGYWLLH